MKGVAMATLSYIPNFSPRVSLSDPKDGSVVFSASNDWEMVGDSAAMKRLRLQIRRIGPHFRIVLVSGERGTGKEMAARALHQVRPGGSGPFVVSSAGNRMDYLIRMARGGTLFFDGIGEMTLEAQDELLEILRRNEWAQDGLAAPPRMNARIIASTDQDLRVLVASGRFRQELHQRIAMVQIAVPTLRERMEDLPLLAANFLQRFARLHGKKVVTIADNAMERLRSHAWEENVRELEEVLRDAALRCEGCVVEAWDLSVPAMTAEVISEADHVVSGEKTAREKTARLQHVVEQHVLQVLKNCAGNKLRTAELLGISRSTLYRMLDACSGGGVQGYTGQ
jgi:DNA-binding NtrC family response regulator